MKKKRLTHQEVEGLKLKYQNYSQKVHGATWLVVLINAGWFSWLWTRINIWNKTHLILTIILLFFTWFQYLNFRYPIHRKQKEIIESFGIEMENSWVDKFFNYLDTLDIWTRRIFLKKFKNK